MINIKDHHTERLFDPWHYLGTKRRQLLKKSWSGLFRDHLFNKIPVNKIASHFDEYNGRPSKELYTAIGVTILQQVHDLSDNDVIEELAFNIQWHYALDITSESDDDKYLCEKTLRTYRKILTEEKTRNFRLNKLKKFLPTVFRTHQIRMRLMMDIREKDIRFNLWRPINLIVMMRNVIRLSRI